MFLYGNLSAKAQKGQLLLRHKHFTPPTQEVCRWVPPVRTAGPWGGPWGCFTPQQNGLRSAHSCQIPLPGQQGELAPLSCHPCAPAGRSSQHFQLLASLRAQHSRPPWRLQALSRAVTPKPTASASPAGLSTPPVPAPSSAVPTTPQQGHPQPPARLTGLAGGTSVRTGRGQRDAAQRQTR